MTRNQNAEICLQTGKSILNIPMELSGSLVTMASFFRNQK